ncbi:MAG: asparagine synthetase B [Gammaproteobacteria bacterium]
MGAIFGIVGYAESEELQRMAERLRHLGQASSVFAASPEVWFGEVQSKEIATQSISTTLPVVLDGFIDNGRELAEVLSLPGSCSDAALLLAVYRRLGHEGFWRIRGQFAAAFWDPNTRTAVLVRDPLGIRSLYLTRLKQRTLFASEYKALLAIEEVPALPDTEAIAHLQRTKYMPLDRSCLRDIRPLPPGHWYELGPEGARRGDYRQLRVNVQARPEAQHASCLRKSLITAASRQTERYNRLGVALSTGIDSALTVAAVRSVAPNKELHTFTAGFGPDDPEMADAAKVARRFDTTHHEIQVSTEQLPELLPKFVWFMEDPIGRDELLYYYLTADTASKWVPILFGGYLSDNLFGGMPRHLIVKAATTLPVFKTALWEFFDYTQSGRVPVSMGGRLLVHGYFRSGLVPQARLRDVPNQGPPPRERPNGREGLNEFMFQTLRNGGNALACIQRLNSSAGIASNALFYDLSVVECAFEIPSSLKIKGQQRKYILREAAQGLLPDEIRRHKKGFLRLRHDRDFCDFLDDLIEDVLPMEEVVARGLFEAESVRHLRQRPASGVYSTEHVYRLWSLLLLEYWSQAFLDQRGRVPSR